MTDFAVTNTFTNGTTADATEVNANFTDIEDEFNGNADSYVQVPTLVPIGSVVAWLKTFASADSGTTTSTTSNKLVETGQNFNTTILVGMIVHNTTDDTFANVTAIDSDTILSLDADIMTSGENYTIYKTPKLPDGWIECDGTSVSDADSPYNGVSVPDLNSGSNRFLRGNIDSGGTGGSETMAHTHTTSTTDKHRANVNAGAVFGTGAGSTTSAASNTENRPPYYDVVFIIRIK